VEGYAGANACAAVDLDAKVDASQFVLRGTERAEKSDQNDAAQLTIESNETDNTDVKSTNKYSLNNPGNEWGMTNTKTQTANSKQTSSLLISDNNSSIAQTYEANQTEQATQTDSLYYDTDTNALTRTKTSKVQRSSDVTWRNEEANKLREENVLGALPDGVLGAGAEGSLSAFAGAKAEAQGSIGAEWKSAETKDNQGFLVLAQAGGGVEGWAGVGASVDFAIRFENNEILLRTKLAAAIGLGAGAQVDMLVSPDNLYNMIAFMYEQLRKADYSFIPYIAEQAWQYIQYALTKYLLSGVSKIKDFIKEGGLSADDAIEIGRAIQKYLIETVETAKEIIETNGQIAIETVKRWWENYQDIIENAEKVALNIKQNPGAIRYASPDSKARLITIFILEYNKLNPTNYTARENIEDAILSVLQWVQSQDEFQKIMQKCGTNPPMRPDPSSGDFIGRDGKIDEALIKQAEDDYESDKLRHGEKQKDDIKWKLDWKQDSLYVEWLEKHLPAKAPKTGPIKPNKHLNDYCKAFYA